MSFQLIKEAMVASLILLSSLLLITLVPFKLERILPIKQELDDFDIYDLSYSEMSKGNTQLVDTNIVIVQNADNRNKIVDQIEKIKTLNPKVIGIDIFFSFSDSLKSESIQLIRALSDSIRIIPAYLLYQDSSNETSFIPSLLDSTYLVTYGGYANFQHTDATSVIRAFAPFLEVGTTKNYAFSSRIVEKYAPNKLAVLQQRENKEELINYSGSLNNYLNYSKSEFDTLYKTNQLTHFKNKIILLGAFSKNDGRSKSMDDAHYSPMNTKTNGRSFPDTYGVVIHANIISMLLNGNRYITLIPIWLTYLFTFFIVFGLLLIILECYKKYKKPSHLLFFIIQMISVILVIWLFLILFNWFHIKVPLLPIVTGMVLSVEMFDLYKWIANFMHKKFKYKTIFYDL
jgi:CHASE2 domain-containing sensor protein